jgi:hypothetical protein
MTFLFELYHAVESHRNLISITDIMIVITCLTCLVETCGLLICQAVSSVFSAVMTV